MLAPLRKTPDAGWEVAAPEDSQFDLTLLAIDEPRELQPPPQAQRATHYLCMLRYDYPYDRPGATFGVHRRVEGPPSWPLAADDDAVPHKVGVIELRSALDLLRTHYGADFERQLVTPDTPSAQEGLCFAFGSCQFPAGMMDRELANASYRALGERFPGGAQLPTRLLLLGDQVYTDATYGLLDPVRLDDRYRAPYEALTARDGPLGQLPQDVLRVMRRTPDDHEIQDDWEPGRTGALDGKYRRGVAAYWRYQRGEKESFLDDAPAAADGPPALKQIWFTEEERLPSGPGWRLFMADSRTVRQFRDEKTVRSALILGEDQTLDLMRWLLGSARDDLKIVTSAAMLLPRTREHVDEPLHLDNWQGYPASLYSLLVLLCENEMRNVVFLSGDAHLACSATVTVTHPATGKSCTFHSHHAPPLYAPYPFANASRHDFLRHDAFDFEWEHEGSVRYYRCTVDTQFPDGTRQGFGLLHAAPGAAGWDLRYEVVSSAGGATA